MNWIKPIVLFVFAIALFMRLELCAQAIQHGGLPKKLHDSFIIKLTRYTDLEIAQDWSALFALTTDSISNRQIPFLKGATITPADYAKRRQSTIESDWSLTRHSLSAVSLVNGSGETTEWLVTGCGKFKQGNKTLTVKTAITAVHFNNEWYFSDVRFLFKGVGMKQYIKCKLPDVRPRG